MDELKAYEAEVEAHPDQQVSVTDEDARSMKKAGGDSTVGYNVQTAVDSKHHLIAAHEVTNATSDRSQLSSMAGKASEALDAKDLMVLADPGYYKGEEIVDCYEAGITALVPKVDTSGKRGKGQYTRTDFIYDAKEDAYVCPAEARLTYRCTTEDKGKQLRVYWTNQCGSCALKSHCTSGRERRIKRWEKEHILEKADALLKKNPDAMRQRKRLVEHPYGTIKPVSYTHLTLPTKRIV